MEPVPILVVEKKLAFWGETETSQASSRLPFFRLAHSAQITSWKNWKGKQSKLMGTSSELVCLCIGLTGTGSIIPVLGTSFVDIPLAYLLPEKAMCRPYLFLVCAQNTSRSLEASCLHGTHDHNSYNGMATFISYQLILITPCN